MNVKEIKFHDNTCGTQYGEDHQLTNNWDPAKDYGTEYVKVHFRINTDGYGYPDFSFSNEKRNAFESEVKEIFSTTGWNKCDATRPREEPIWMCSFLSRGKESLYAHPQDISGLVLKNNVAILAELFSNAKTFQLLWVDLYRTYYDMTDSEVDVYYDGKHDEIRNFVLQNAKTKRTDRFVSVSSLCSMVDSAYGILLASEYEDAHFRYISKAAWSYTKKIIKEGVDEGVLIKMQSDEFTVSKPGSDDTIHAVRTINKTEQRKKKLLITI